MLMLGTHKVHIAGRGWWFANRLDLFTFDTIK